MSNPWDGFCEWVYSQAGNLDNILDGLSMLRLTPCSIVHLLGHQSTYSDIGSTAGDAFAAHAPNSLLPSAWHMLVLLFLTVWAALYLGGRRADRTEQKPKRVRDNHHNDDHDHGVGGLN